MLYSFDGTDIEHMPVRQAYWATDVQSVYIVIGRLQREKPEPFKAFNASGRKRRQMGGLDEGYEDEYYMEDMMMEDMGRGPY